MLCFFFKQKTAYEMRISDWSSDVCSSDLKLRIELAKDRENLRFADFVEEGFRARPPMIGCLDLEQRPKLGLEAVFPTASGQACLKALADGKGEPRGLIRFVEFAKRQEGSEAVVQRGPVAGTTGTGGLNTTPPSGQQR